MMFIDELYQKTVADNEKNLKFWEDYLNGLKSLNFDVYAEKLKVPILVPIGNKIFFRGELKHTNEVTVSLGADYFVKCSTKQAEVIRQHRIKDAQTKVDLFRKENEYLENQISFTKQNIFDKDGQEILEVYSEEEDKIWREKHRDNIRKYKQEEAKDKTKPKDDTTDEELWERLEELELQEELENELLDNYNEIVDKRKENKFLENQQALLLSSFKEENTKIQSEDVIQNKQQHLDRNIDLIDTVKSNENKMDTVTDISVKEISKNNLLKQVLDKQTELDHKLQELKNREREKVKSEQDLISKLDELEELDDLEDEMDRLDHILETEDVDKDDSGTEDAETEEDSIESDEDTSSSNTSRKLKKSISFADEDNSETLEITFTHSDAEPNNYPYNQEKGISKPSDLYEAYSYLFNNKTTSILKKSKYGPEVVKEVKKVKFGESVEAPKSSGPEEIDPVDRTIVIKDVVENVAVNQHNIEGGARPTSLFKQRRMQNKS